MKILYASCRYDPSIRDAGSGVDFNFYGSLAQLESEIRIAGPFEDKCSFFEKLYRKAHRYLSKKLAAKYSEAYLRFCGKEVDRIAEEYQPDVIITHNLIPLVYSKTKFPVVYGMDAVLYNMHPEWPTYSKLELKRMLRWEKKALQRTTLAIAHSQWAANALMEHYHMPASRVMVTPICSSLPNEVIPENIKVKPLDQNDLHLLLVGRVYQRKGIDIAIQAVQLLRAKGIGAHLRIVGLDGKDEEGIEFMGLYKKADPSQMKEYVSQYQWAHFLIHPARFEAAGIVCGEAAAFGIPTITNAAGGLATTVKDGVSGVVLPKASKAEKYVEVIERYLNAPATYRALCLSTRKRYEEELNLDTVVKHIDNKIIEVLDIQKNKKN